MTFLSMTHPVTRITSLAAIVLLTTQCATSDATSPMVAGSVAAERFAGEPYAGFAIDEAAAAEATSVTVIEGDVEGPVTGETYRYLVALADGRTPIEGFMSTPASNEIGAVALAESDARDQLRDCSKNNADAQDMFACMDAVMAQVALDCELSVGTPSCASECWLEPAQC